MPIIDELIYKVGYKTDEKSAAVAVQRAKKIGTVIAGAVTAATAAASGLFALTKQFANTADSSVKTSDKLGLSVEKLQELRFAADQSGIAQGKFDTALQRMVRRVGEAAQGTGSAAKLLEKYGVSADKLSKMTADEQFLSLAQAFKESAKEGQELSDVFKLFDTEGVDIVRMFQAGPDAIRELMKQRRDIGGIISDEDARRSEKFNDTINRITIRFKSLSQELFSKLLPVFDSLVTSFEKWISKNDSWMKIDLAGKVQEFIGFLKEIKPLLDVIGVALNVVFKTIGVLFDGLIYAVKSVSKAITLISDSVDWLIDKFTRLIRMATKLGSGILGKILSAPGKVIDTVQKAFDNRPQVEPRGLGALVGNKTSNTTDNRSVKIDMTVNGANNPEILSQDLLRYVNQGLEPAAQ